MLQQIDLQRELMITINISKWSYFSMKMVNGENCETKEKELVCFMVDTKTILARKK